MALAPSYLGFPSRLSDRARILSIVVECTNVPDKDWMKLLLDVIRPLQSSDNQLFVCVSGFVLPPCSVFTLRTNIRYDTKCDEKHGHHSSFKLGLEYIT